MYRPRSAALLSLVLAGALATAACADDDPIAAPSDPPVEITQTFADTLTVNGGVTHQFVVQRAGSVLARLTSLTPSEAVIGLSIGPLTAQGCSQSIANDAATSGTAVTGTASTAGNFCVRVFDAGGTLAGPVDYEVTVTHF